MRGPKITLHMHLAILGVKFNYKSVSGSRYNHRYRWKIQSPWFTAVVYFMRRILHPFVPNQYASNLLKRPWKANKNTEKEITQSHLLNRLWCHSVWCSPGESIHLIFCDMVSWSRTWFWQGPFFRFWLDKEIMVLWYYK